MRRRQCIDCDRRGFPGVCPGCAANRRLLAALHAEGRRRECRADRLGRALRVAQYAAVVARGGRLFE